MIAKHTKAKLALALVATALLTLAGVTGAHAATAPVKEIVASHIGTEVDKVTKGKICTVESKHECQPAKLSGEAGGFKFAKSVAVAPNGNVYVADGANNRLQELNAKGEFLLMIGKEVNKKGGDICTKAEESQCQAGTEGADPGQPPAPQSVVVNPVSEDVYVAETIIEHIGGELFFGDRVQEFTPSGQFVLMIGKEVNETTKGNLCTQKEIEGGKHCKGPALTKSESPYVWGNEQGAFNYPESDGNVLAVGGGGLLYVGDEHRVQEFNAETGAPVGEIPLPGTVARIAADKAGDVYLNEEGETSIREFDPSGKEIRTFAFPSNVFIFGLALDPAGHLAVIDETKGPLQGRLYEVGLNGLHLITEFADEGNTDLAFNNLGGMYGVNSSEVIAYNAVPVGEFLAGLPQCVAGAQQATNAIFNCVLSGEVDPWGVQGTRIWFQWGLGSSLSNKTTPSSVGNEPGKKPGEEEKLVNVSAAIAGLRPNERFSDQVVGEDENVISPELLSSPVNPFTTPTVPPRIIGEPSVLLVGPSSSVIFAEMNPENTSTSYEIQYAPESTCASLEETASCPHIAQTTAQGSNAYGQIGVVQEATGLSSGTAYRYRLFATNEKGETAVTQTGEKHIPEGVFTTAPIPTPQAGTGPASAVTQTSAIISGTVEPNGQPATYTFELGINNGPSTQYGTVFSGPVTAQNTPLQETLELTGLQPGTTYSYRITLASGYIQNQTHTTQAASLAFTTAGLPEALHRPIPPQMLATPPIPFPNTTKPPTCKLGYALNKHNTCVKSKTTKKKTKHAKHGNKRHKAVKK
jgi:hypothetical protein